jgi:phosphoribosylanthranilate isomerase
VASVLLIHVSTAEAVAELCRQIRPAAIQVQRDIREGDLRVVKEEFPEIRIVKTVHVYPDSAESEICARVSEDLEGEVVDAINLDSRESKSNQQTGGTGLTHDWNISASVVRRIGSGRVILAGGLTAENVRRAIETVGPGAVDVMSGVEDESGVKNPLKVQAFFGALRT